MTAGSPQYRSTTGIAQSFLVAGGNPLDIASDGTHIWTVNDDYTVSEIDPTTGLLLQVHPMPLPSWAAYRSVATIQFISADHAHVWVYDGDAQVLLEYSTATGQLVMKSKGLSGCEISGIATDGTNLWYSSSGWELGGNCAGWFGRVTESTGVVHPMSAPYFLWGIAADGTNVWGLENYWVDKFSETGTFLNRVAKASPDEPSAFVAQGGSLWIGTYWGSIYQVPENGQPEKEWGYLTFWSASQDALLTANPYGLAYDGSHLWLASPYSGYVNEFSPSSGTLVQTIKAPTDGLSSPEHVAICGSTVWVSNSAGGSVTEFSTVTGAYIGTFPT
jgi:hypothetical protein